jgi:hypothetical protein
MLSVLCLLLLSFFIFFFSEAFFGRDDGANNLLVLENSIISKRFKVFAQGSKAKKGRKIEIIRPFWVFEGT